jgi:hypothetical protein
MARTPPAWFDPLLAWSAVAPLALGAGAAWLAPGAWRATAMSLTLVWAGAILAYQAGVRRGLAGETSRLPALWLFVLAVGSMVALEPLTSLAILILGYVSLAMIVRRTRSSGPTITQTLLALGALGLVAARLVPHR